MLESNHVSLMHIVAGFDLITICFNSGIFGKRDLAFKPMKCRPLALKQSKSDGRGWAVSMLAVTRRFSRVSDSNSSDDSPLKGRVSMEHKSQIKSKSVSDSWNMLYCSRDIEFVHCTGVHLLHISQDMALLRVVTLFSQIVHGYLDLRTVFVVLWSMEIYDR